jgi:hypothetical protein
MKKYRHKNWGIFCIKKSAELGTFAYDAMKPTFIHCNIEDELSWLAQDSFRKYGLPLTMVIPQWRGGKIRLGT